MNFLHRTVKRLLLPHVKQTPVQLIVFSIFMLFVLVPNGATSFCSLRLISEATKQNGMGHTTTLRENLMNLVLSSSWVNKITVSALIVITQFQGNFVCTYLPEEKYYVIRSLYFGLRARPLFKYTYAGAGAARREHNRAFQFSSDLWPDGFKQLSQRPSTELCSDF